jgi:hypothetical protein
MHKRKFQMRHINRRRDKNSTYGDPGDTLTEPRENDYIKSYRNNGFKNASSKNTYVKFLRYIADNPGSTRKEILDGLGRLKGAACGGRGQNSSLFAQLLYLDLIDYDDKFKYFITDKGEEVLEKANKNDEKDAGPDSAMESTKRTTMKRLNITKEQFNKSKYFQRKYGRLEYVSESGRYFKTDKGHVLRFNESKKRQFNEKLDYVGSTEHSVTLCNDCPFCGEHYEFTLDMDFDEFMDSMWKYKNGELLQNAFPNLSPDEREQIKTGICAKCWDEM